MTNRSYPFTTVHKVRKTHPMQVISATVKVEHCECLNRLMVEHQINLSQAVRMMFDRAIAVDTP